MAIRTSLNDTPSTHHIRNALRDWIRSIAMRADHFAFFNVDLIAIKINNIIWMKTTNYMILETYVQ